MNLVEDGEGRESVMAGLRVTSTLRLWDLRVPGAREFMICVVGAGWSG